MKTDVFKNAKKTSSMSSFPPIRLRLGLFSVNTTKKNLRLVFLSNDLSVGK